jgi:type IV pilus assembly protein PilO
MAPKFELGISKESIKKLTPLQRWLITGFLLLIIIILAIFLLYLPVNKEISTRKKNIEKLESDLQTAKNTLLNLEKIKEEYEKLEKKLAEYIKQLPSEAEVEKVMLNVGSIGKEVNVEFLKFIPKEDVPGTGGLYSIVPIETEISGKFHNIALFLDRVAKMERIVKPVDFSITPVEDKTGNVILNTKLLLETYKYTPSSGKIEQKGVKK